MLVTLEGIHCTGKTTIGKLLAQEYEIINYIPEATQKNYSKIQGFLDNDPFLRCKGHSPHAQAFVLAIDALEKSTQLTEGINIADRYFESVIQYMIPNFNEKFDLSSENSYNILSDIIKGASFYKYIPQQKADISLLLIGNKELIFERLQKRYDNIIEEDLSYLFEIQENYVDLMKDKYVIDVSDYNSKPDELAKTIIQILEVHTNGKIRKKGSL